MIATYIQELLATNNRVIVPNYGAFLVRATSKSKDANTLEEKLKDIYFSPFLKFNDELLEKHIIKKENITKEQAAQKITEFIDTVKKELEQEKPYTIEGFGEFVADKQGKVQFNTVEAKEVETPKETKKPAAKTTTTTKKATVAKETKAVKKAKIEEKPKAEETTKTASQAVKKETKLEEFKPEKKEEEKAPPTQTKSIYNYKKEKKPINKGLVWSIAIGVPLAAVFVWALLNFSTIKKVFDKDKAKTEKVAQTKKTTKKKTATKPEAKQEAKKQETEKAEPKKTEVKKPEVPQKKYYIIAGSFKNEKYAISYLNKLKTEGYNAEKLEQRNGMFAVSFNSFADKRKAIAEYKFLAQEKGLQAWILYY